MLLWKPKEATAEVTLKSDRRAMKSSSVVFSFTQTSITVIKVFRGIQVQCIILIILFFYFKIQSENDKRESDTLPYYSKIKLFLMDVRNCSLKINFMG